MCHCNRWPIDLSVPSLKVCISSSKRRLCTKLWATRSPWPLSYTLTLADEGKDLPLSWKEGCHSAATWEVDAIFTPVWTVGSWMTIPIDDRGGSPCGCISRVGRGLFYRVWSLPSAAGWRRKRGSLILALGSLLLQFWLGTGHKTANCHCLSCHHVVTLVRFSF